MRLRTLFYTHLLLFPLWAAGCGGAETVGAGTTARAPDLRRGTLETSKGPVPITYEVIHGRAIFEGDIDLGSADGIHPESAGIADASRRFNTGDLWRNGVVWYRIDHDNVAPWLEK